MYWRGRWRRWFWWLGMEGGHCSRRAAGCNLNQRPHTGFWGSDVHCQRSQPPLCLFTFQFLFLYILPSFCISHCVYVFGPCPHPPPAPNPLPGIIWASLLSHLCFRNTLNSKTTDMEDAIKKLVTTFLKSSRGKENLDSKSFQKMVSSNLGNIMEVNGGKDKS